jgi:hypothetical protein
VKDTSPSAASPLYDRELLLHGCKRNEVLTLSEIEQYGLDSFTDRDYVSIYGMSPREWYRLGIRMLGRTAVECTRDSLGNQIGRDVASIAARMSSTTPAVVIDPFAGSCNTLYWILRYLTDADGVAFESDTQIYELTHRNLAVFDQKIKLLRGDYVELLENCELSPGRSIVAFVAPPWGTALDEERGLDLRRTTPPVISIVDRISQRFAKHKILFAIQIYEKLDVPSLTQLQAHADWTEVRVYDINGKGHNHGVLLATRGWTPR